MIETLVKLLPREPYANIAIYSDNEALLTALRSSAVELNGNIVDLRQYNLKQLPFGGEYFELIILDSSSHLEDERIVLQLKRAIQKNRYIIVVSGDVDQWSLAERLEPYGFSDFSTIKEGDLNINLFKKWFAL